MTICMSSVFAAQIFEKGSAMATYKPDPERLDDDCPELDAAWFKRGSCR